MDITIIGTGNVGKALTKRVVAGGQRVTLLGTAPEKADESSAYVRPGTLLERQVGGQSLDVFLASDDDVDSGPLARTQKLEALGFLHMALQGPLGTGPASAVKVLS